MSDTQKWWQKALSELQQHMTDDPALVVTQDRIWWASANFVEQASVIFEKHEHIKDKCEWCDHPGHHTLAVVCEDCRREIKKS